MKKILLGILTVFALNTYAQKFNVESAAIAMKRYVDPTSNADDKKAAIEEGKTAIDKAYANAESQADPRMWSLRANIYLAIAIDTAVGINDPKAIETAME